MAEGFFGNIFGGNDHGLGVGSSTPPEYASPEQIKAMREYAKALSTPRPYDQPVHHWTQGANDILRAILGVWMMKYADRKQREAQAGAATQKSGMGLAPGTEGATAPAAGEQAAPAAQGGQQAPAAPETPTAPGTEAKPSAGAQTAPESQTAQTPFGLTGFAETGQKDPLKGAGSVVYDTGGSRSYGNLGLNSGGSAGEFAATYGARFGLTARPGTPQFDAQWRAAAARDPQGLHAAELEWHNANILKPTGTRLQAVGIPPEVSDDPRVQTYFADRTTQHGKGSIDKSQKHSDRIKIAWNSSDKTPEGFLRRMSDLDRSAMGVDFRRALETKHPITGKPIYGDKAHNYRIDTRLSGALAAGATPTPQQEAAEGTSVAAPETTAQPAEPIRNPTRIPPREGQGYNFAALGGMPVQHQEMFQGIPRTDELMGKYARPQPAAQLMLNATRGQVEPNIVRGYVSPDIGNPYEVKIKTPYLSDWGAANGRIVSERFPNGIPGSETMKPATLSAAPLETKFGEPTTANLYPRTSFERSEGGGLARPSTPKADRAYPTPFTGNYQVVTTDELLKSVPIGSPYIDATDGKIRINLGMGR